MSNTIGNKQFLDDTGLRKVFTLIKSYFEKYVTKKDFEDTELSVSAALNDLNQRIENIDVPDMSSFTTKVYVDTEVDILDDKINNVEEKLEEQIKNIVYPEDKIQGISVDGTEITPNEEGIVNIELPDTSNFVTNEDLNEVKDDISTVVETINSDIDKIKEDISNLDIDTTDLASKEYVDNEILEVKDLIPTVPEQLKAGNNITINDNQINAEGYNYKKTSTGAVNLTLNYGGDNIPSVHNAGGDYTTVCGYNCKTTDGSSSANSFCGGDNSIVSNEVCFVYGEGLTTGNSHQTVLGKYNNTINWNEQNVPLVIGWGTENAKKTIMALQDGSQSSNSGSDGGLMLWGPLKAGAGWLNSDFGEYFEWADGNIDNEDRIGYMVQLSGEKIELAKSFKKCIGVISATCSFIGGACSLEWHSRFLKDEWGRHLYDENNNLIVNPKYDESKEYKPRSQRKEWDIVGLLGQVLVRQDGTLKVGGFAGCDNGIATDATKGYHVLNVINENIALVLVK